eukprot:1322820-Amorphochlora_amoeboformis.AAC.1
MYTSSNIGKEEPQEREVRLRERFRLDHQTLACWHRPRPRVIIIKLSLQSRVRLVYSTGIRATWPEGTIGIRLRYLNNMLSA